MMAARHAQSRNYVGNKKILLRHSTSTREVQVHCSSQEKYEIAPKMLQVREVHEFFRGQ
jgi:hypothetical protein